MQRTDTSTSPLLGRADLSLKMAENMTVKEQAQTQARGDHHVRHPPLDTC